MDMENRLTGSGPVVNHHPVPFYVESLLVCDLLGGQEQMAHNLPVLRGHGMDLGNMFFWYNEYMHRSLRVEIFKRGGKFILINDLCGDLL